MPQERAVFAGGCFWGMLDLLRARGVVICLHAPIGTIVQRTMHTDHRPLLQVDDREQRVDLDLNHSPDNLEINTEIVVNQLVAHAGDAAPRVARR